MDSHVVQTANPEAENKRPVGVSDQMAKVTLEYDLPFFRGLTLTGGVYYYGCTAQASAYFRRRSASERRSPHGRPLRVGLHHLSIAVTDLAGC